MSSIGDIFLRLLLEKSGEFQAAVEKEAGKAGDAGAQTLGQRLGSGLKTSLGVGLKGVAVATTAAFGIAAKGVLDIDNAVADFRAETGATAEEATRAGKAINAMSGRNIQGIEEIGKTLTKVTTDLGLSGDEAERVTELMLKYARATGQDAVGATTDLDDILDAWNLTATDAEGILDKLVVSHQNYGGSIEENQKALAALAPTLQAANLTIDDGIGLLNLFAASGVDSAVAVTGMQKALTKVKSPAELQALIADIQATDDDFLRAQKAADLFGAKAGAKMANALKPGSKALSDYRIDATEAAGATREAAEAADSAFSTQVQLKIKAIGAAIREVGPAVTGVASALSILSMFGLDAVFRKLWDKVAGSALVKAAVAAAGAAAGAIYSAAASTASTLIGAITGAWTAVRTSGPVLAAATAAGGALGAAFVAGVATAGLALTAIIGDQIIEGGKDEIRRKVQAAVAGGTTEGIEAARREVLAGLRSAQAGHNSVLIAFFEDQLRALDAASQGDAATLHQTMLDRGADIGAGLGEGISQGAAAEVPKVQDAGGSLAQAFQGGFTAQLAQANQAVALGLEGIASARTIIEKARVTGATTAGAFADAIRTRRLEVDSAWDLLLSTIKDHGTSNRAKVIGRLVSKTLAHALSSSNVEVRLRAEDTQRIYLENLSEIIPRGKGLSGRAAKAVADGLRSHNPDVRRAAEKVRSVAERPLKTLPSDAYGWGAKAGDSFADGIRSQIRNASNAAGKISTAVARILRLESPAKEGPMSKGGGPEGWGRRLPKLWARGADHEVPAVRAVMSRMAKVVAVLREHQLNALSAAGKRMSAALSSGLAMPALSAPTAGFSAPALAPAHAGFGATVTSVDPAGGGGDTFQLNTYGLPMRAETPLEVVGQWRRAARMGPQRARTGRWRNE